MTKPSITDDLFDEIITNIPVHYAVFQLKNITSWAAFLCDRHDVKIGDIFLYNPIQQPSHNAYLPSIKHLNKELFSEEDLDLDWFDFIFLGYMSSEEIMDKYNYIVL